MASVQSASWILFSGYNIDRDYGSKEVERDSTIIIKEINREATAGDRAQPSLKPGEELKDL